ncbi:hypothetical protein CSPX01_07959 [Colletotrichum filicis]|nr:hypothetical protein CSPX01_07959 [Colletotrichum filicis]
MNRPDCHKAGDNLNMYKRTRPKTWEAAVRFIAISEDINTHTTPHHTRTDKDQHNYTRLRPSREMDPPPRRLRLVPKVTFILSSIAIHYQVVKFVYNNHTPHDLLNPSLLFVLPCTIFIISHGLGVLRHHAFIIALRREFGVIGLWLFYFLPVLIQIVLWLRLAQWVTATVPWLMISAFRLSPIVILLFLAVQLWRRTSRQTQQFPAREHRLVAQRVDELADGPIHVPMQELNDNWIF